ncbi:TetR/AcrR family transcriptional regulator [Streptomyces sp. NPDC056909]|uniref:TetR/AcrR family transcriptional regulator n=1 Tax=Streptomyces sp. NPDC056909 TaxID=3345963 RepID=UPI003686D3A4
MLKAAADLVARSANGDVSVRAVCEAAGVGAPALYRNFGDKEGLLSAVVDQGFDTYLATKKHHSPRADPVEDLRDGWDSHVDFALRNPNRYRLMNSPAMRTPPGAALESHRILERDLGRAAARGGLRLTPELAAQVVMSANVGVALMLVSRPSTFTDPSTSRRVRDAVHAAVLAPEATGPGTASADDSPDESDESDGADGADGADGTQVASAAARLGALLHRSPSSVLSTTEAALMTEWLNRLSNTP